MSSFENKSYLVARDPSLIQRNRCLVQTTKLNFSDIEKPSNVKKSNNNCIKVFLKIKGGCENIDHSMYDIKRNVIICNSHNNVKKKYTFTKIFPCHTSQRQFFNCLAKPKLFDFINGINSSIFTYGASGSGKTYTIVGTPEEPGLIPRSLEYIFRSISSMNKAPLVSLQPDDSVILMNSKMQKELEDKKQFILSATSHDQAFHIKIYRQMQDRLSLERVANIEQNDNVNISLWVSFCEIYNECIYDLLVKTPSNNQVRPKLELGITKDGVYIKNLTLINICNGIEAFQILQFGLQNLNYAATAINSHSSRSHCIFTIKMVQTSKSKNEVFINNFNFCDLAGAERLKKTLNKGTRLKESNNINTSLFVLGKCMENIRKLQKEGDHVVVPFRESKLTYLFQKAFLGQERIEMIVNINTSRDMFDETIHVLNFSAIAKDILLEEQMPLKLSKKINGLSSSMGDKNNEIEDLKNQVNYLQLKYDRLKKDYKNLEEAYEELVDNRDMMDYDQLIQEEKEYVEETYKDLIKKLKMQHSEEIKKLKAKHSEEIESFVLLINKYKSEVVYISSDESDNESVKLKLDDELVEIEDKLIETEEEVMEKKEQVIETEEKIIETEEKVMEKKEQVIETEEKIIETEENFN